MGRVAGKAIVITGAGSGMGRAFAIALAAEGAIVGVLDLRADAAQQVCDEIGEARGGADRRRAASATRWSSPLTPSSPTPGGST